MRLSELELLSIDNERSRMINVAKMIGVFAEEKARKTAIPWYFFRYFSSYLLPDVQPCTDGIRSKVSSIVLEYGYSNVSK